LYQRKYFATGIILISILGFSIYYLSQEDENELTLATTTSVENSGLLDMLKSEFDVDNGLHKISPLLDWSSSEIWEYIKDFNVPYNTLHDQGYSSIGCAPCTRSITPGEDIRAGRWWWESPDHKECGLHLPHDTHEH